MEIPAETVTQRSECLNLYLIAALRFSLRASQEACHEVL